MPADAAAGPERSGPPPGARAAGAPAAPQAPVPGSGLDGRVAVVTGGSRGIGRAVCAALARRGARVVVGYRSDAEGAEETAAHCAALGGAAVPRRFDVADYASVTAAVTAVARAHRRVDILVNNAGVGDAAAVLPTGPVEEWAAPVRTNCIKAASAYLLMSGRGAIVNVACIAGITGIAGLSGYAASKAGILGMTRALSREYARHRVRVNAVAPGYTADTGMVARIDDVSLKEIVGRVALERLARPEEIAAAVAFLASDEAAYITGHTLVVDGGLTA